ncbi:aldehyde dehydrogenase family protein [Microtetraspora sp. NBRC 16547]|uniref:aldehyde dehydrogenase family protein n=1 Tax=Microtetraspora sp. NBRC 16547 TaxID=3030993 RepID=UPI0024A3A3E7|nr:aldehyde dehydrogenase family protein [Microtetraspora sp. NBRC 16547]GLX02550.1 aldehyde dehydrogenase [Microtetraspora sp. NBRC 16547]
MTGGTYQVRDPRTGEIHRELCPPAPAELAEAAARLRAAQPRWAALPAERRAAALLTWREEIAGAQDELVAALTSDTGRLTESVLEVGSVLGMLERWAGQAPELLTPPPPLQAAIPGIEIRGAGVPYPLVGVISPWNFPLLLGLIDAIPALAAGCAVLAKPSEVTPRFIAPLMKTAAQVPDLADVITMVEGDGATGASIVRLVDAVAFTGSVPTGRIVAAAAAEAFIPAFLELGGKDPAIVLAGADLDRASSSVLWGATANAGQSCLSIERVYVEEAAYEEFLDLLVRKAGRLTLAYPGPGDGQIGPLIDPAQAAVIERHLTDALEKGATVRCGGRMERLGGGRWCLPTVLTDVDHGMLVMTEETFGPIVPVMRVRDADHAVELANDSSYGLSAAVFASDSASALSVADRLLVGAVSVNDSGLTAFVHEGEKNSFNSSGLGGSRMGPASLSRFLRRRSYLINNSTGPDPWWH